MTWWERLLEPDLITAMALLVTAIGGMQIWQIADRVSDRAQQRRRDQESAAISSDVARVRDQVVNGHEPRNLRDDLDEHRSLLERIEKILDGHSMAIGGIRDDIRQIHHDTATERTERLDLEASARIEHDRIRADIAAVSKACDRRHTAS